MEERVYDFLISCHRVFYLATAEDDCPDLRPFGAVIMHDNHAVFCTGSDKRVYRQISKNPNVCICACYKGVKWMRLKGKALFFEDDGAKKKMLALEDRLRRKYGENGDGLVLFRITDGHAVFSERGKDDEILAF